MKYIFSLLAKLVRYSTVYTGIYDLFAKTSLECNIAKPSSGGGGGCDSSHENVVAT
jgi:hypothetical protein